MGMLELAIWSAAAGAIALVVLICLVDLTLVRSAAAAQGAAYNLAAVAFVLVMSGVPQALFPAFKGTPAHVAQVLMGPLCVCLGNYWIRGWLAARHRDRFMDISLLATAILSPIAALLCLLLQQGQQIPAAAVLVLLNMGLVVWMSTRAWLLGDALALGIAIGSAVMMLAVGGLYAVAMGAPAAGIGSQAVLAFLSVASIALIGFMLWKRNQHARRSRGIEAVQSQFDPVTKLPGGLPFVRQLIRAQQRRRLTQREGVVIAVIVFEPERIVAQAGAAALNDVYVTLAHRMQRQIGVVNPVGRYWDRCFVALVETIHSPAALRTLGLRVASTMRRPMQVGAGEDRINVRADIGVGVVRLGRESVEVEDLLHEAQQLAEAARHMPSRAAARDPKSGEPVPVEHAQLGPRRRGRFGVGVHAVAPSLRLRV
jgi:GGDEF domain-containing protein